MSSNLRRIILKVLRLALVVAVLVLLYDSWRAVVEETEPNRLIVPFQAGRTGQAQVYYDVGNGLSEKNSAKVDLEVPGELRELAFPLPQEPLHLLRFDPFTGAGAFRIGAPRLESGTGRVIAKFPLDAIKPRNQIGTFRREGDVWVGATVAGAQDPQLTLVLPRQVRAGIAGLPWVEAAVVVGLVAMVGALGRERARG